MAAVGMLHLVAAPITSHTDGTAITYGAGFLVGPAVDASITFNYNDNPDYGEDIIQDNDNGINGYSGTLENNYINAANAAKLAAAIKALPIALSRPRPLAEAISSAGGVRLEALDEALQCRSAPGLFFAGEMLDWEAPTGGYLLTACFASAWNVRRGSITYRQESLRSFSRSAASSPA